VSSQRKEEEKDNAETQNTQRRRRGRLRKKIYIEDMESAEDREFGEERNGKTGDGIPA
jgi:hypothetical protein